MTTYCAYARCAVEMRPHTWNASSANRRTVYRPIGARYRCFIGAYAHLTTLLLASWQRRKRQSGAWLLCHSGMQSYSDIPFIHSYPGYIIVLYVRTEHSWVILHESFRRLPGCRFICFTCERRQELAQGAYIICLLLLHITHHYV